MNPSNAPEPVAERAERCPVGVIDSLEDLVRVVETTPNLFVRWSRGPEVDVGATSVDHLSGVELPGLSANPLAVEEWWGDRPTRAWVARRLYDYRHLGRNEGVAPWLMVGEEVARGPDNEPLVHCIRPVARLGAGVVEEAIRTVEQFSGSWGPLDRGSAPGDPHGGVDEH